MMKHKTVANKNPRPAKTEQNDSVESHFMTSTEFDEAKYLREWLVRSILLPGQPAVIGGPKKSLKTSLVLDMAISLGSGAKFLDRFKVTKPTRVAVLSGESGGAELQAKARLIAESKKITLGDADVLWSFDLPRLGSKSDLSRLSDALEEHGVKVVFLDPLYLCLLGGTKASASNLFEVGPLLRNAAEACLSAGATPVFVHHTTKGASKDGYAGPLGLEHLAFAGIAEFARQWLLINRRAHYSPGSGEHRLVLVAGGSAGHSGCWNVDVSEGVLDDDLGGRGWEVKVRKYDGGAKEDSSGLGYTGSL
jgi:AAA domain